MRLIRIGYDTAISPYNAEDLADLCAILVRAKLVTLDYDHRVTGQRPMQFLVIAEAEVADERAE